MEISMNTNLSQRSARIYRFPPGGRAALGKGRYEETKATADSGRANLATPVYSGSWYHEAAVEEAREARER
jgi:hypothetical protein